MRCIRIALLAIALAGPAWSWWGDGHSILTRAAVRALPDDLPAFFRTGEEVIAGCVYDPDLFKGRGVPHLKDAEGPEHYFDHELVAGRELPSTRYAFIQMCLRAGVEPERVGMLPYAIAEWTEALAMAFAEYRRWPASPGIESRCLVYAGLLAHYAQDACQPLHLTIHFNGRARPDGSSPHTGIHEKVDALIERLELAPEDLAEAADVHSLDSLMPAILAEIAEGRARVDQVYELGRDFASHDSEEVRAFAAERARAATRFTAALYLTAWELSGRLQLPDWFRPMKPLRRVRI